MKWDEFFVTGEPMIYGAMVSIVVASLAIVIGLTYFKKWGYLWREWLTTVDHKRIGIMYIISALLMLFPAVLMRCSCGRSLRFRRTDFLMRSTIMRYLRLTGLL